MPSSPHDGSSSSLPVVRIAGIVSSNSPPRPKRNIFPLVKKPEVTRAKDDWGHDPDNWPDKWQRTPIDLVGLEENFLRKKPVFTRERLEEYAKVRDGILTNKNRIQYFSRDLEDNNRRIWERRSTDDDTVTFHYLSRVELDASLHKRNSEGRSPAIECLH
jgi:hypothetical protein